MSSFEALPPGVAADPEAFAAARAKVERFASLSHPNIIQTTGLELAAGGYGILIVEPLGPSLMSLVELARELRRPPRGPVIVRIMMDACEGLRHLHEEGAPDESGRPLVHGSISLDSLILGSMGAVKVGGFVASALAVSSASVREDVVALGSVLRDLLLLLASDPLELDIESPEGRLARIADRAQREGFVRAASLKAAIYMALMGEPATRSDVAAWASEMTLKGPLPVDSRADL